MPRGRMTDVDHTGRFDKYREEKLHDPYITEKALKEPTICPVCSAIYHKKRWQFDKKMLAELKLSKKYTSQKCPADRKIEDNYPMGIINLSGSFVAEHRDELVNLIKSEERHALEKNPLEKIMSIKTTKDGIQVETTSETLALRIGRILTRAYKGKHEYSFSYGDKYVTIEWRRD